MKVLSSHGIEESGSPFGCTWTYEGKSYSAFISDEARGPKRIGICMLEFEQQLPEKCLEQPQAFDASYFRFRIAQEIADRIMEIQKPKSPVRVDVISEVTELHQTSLWF
ncbi:MAG: hypothetical protein M3Q80_02305 [bacterium]|nr:hypothetical protein [bacterium]